MKFKYFPRIAIALTMLNLAAIGLFLFHLEPLNGSGVKRAGSFELIHYPLESRILELEFALEDREDKLAEYDSLIGKFKSLAKGGWYPHSYDLKKYYEAEIEFLLKENVKLEEELEKLRKARSENRFPDKP